jgi:hypothetical protein
MLTEKRAVTWFVVVVLILGVVGLAGSTKAYGIFGRKSEEKKSLETNMRKIQPDKVYYNKKTYPCYPKTLDFRPDIPSPFTTKDGMDILLSLTNHEKYTLIPVTVENGNPLLYSRRIKSQFGKDSQLHVNSGDFPSLAKTGLHLDDELEKKDMITGIPVSLITHIGRPNRFSWAGFMAEDEDIISVLKGDNNLVKKLGLTHPQMAKPLFHVWNIILKEMELGKFGRFSNIKHFFYNGKKVILKAEGTKGWQVSIFQDEIQGKFDLNIRREMSITEKAFLKERYSNLPTHQMSELQNKLSNINFSEMLPYYIMRYGFYEGHTDYRCDPIAIAWIFGFKSLEEIEGTFNGKLYEALTKHFTNQKLGLN